MNQKYKSSFREYYNSFCKTRLKKSLDLTKIDYSNKKCPILGTSINFVFLDEYATIEPITWENLIEYR